MNYLIIATVCFSLSFGLIKNQLVSIPSDLIAFLRLFIATIIFIPLIKKVNLKQTFIAGGIGIIQFGLMYIFFIRAFKYLQGNEIVLLTTSTPALVAICASLFGEKFKPLYILSILLSILGAVIVIWDNVSFNFFLKGILLMEASNLCFALGQVLWKKYIYESSEKLIFFAYLTSAIFVLPLAFINSHLETLHISTLQWLSILYLGTIPTGIGFWLWNKGSKLVSATMLSIANNLKIPFGIFFALVLFKEQINAINFLIGSLFILAAIITTHKLTTKEN